MAIAYDTSGSARAAVSGGTASINLTASGSDRLALIFYWQDTPTTTPTIQVDGNNATEIVGVNLNSNQRIGCFYYVNPPTSSVAYTGTVTGGKSEIYVHLYTGCDTSSVPDSNATKTTGTSPSVLTTTVVASDCWLASILRDYDVGDNVASTGTTLRIDGVGAGSGDSNGTVGTGSQSMTWTHSGNAGGVVVSFAPAGGGGGGSSFTPKVITF